MNSKHQAEDKVAEVVNPVPLCIGCNRTADMITSVVEMAEFEGMKPDDWVKEQEGTYNPLNGHFLCDLCYIRSGMPSSPRGWKAP